MKTLEILYQEKKILDGAWQWSFDLLNSSRSRQEILMDLIQNMMQWFSIEEIAFFELEEGQFKIVKAFRVKSGQWVRWKLSSPMKQNFQSPMRQALDRGKIFTDKTYSYLPLLGRELKEGKLTPETFPWGVWVMKNFPNQENFVEILSYLARRASLEILNINREKELSQKHQAFTREKSLLETSLKESQKAVQFRFNYDRIVGGAAPRMVRVLEILEKIIPVSTSVLIEGESGTGKELVAQAIHYNGPFAKKNLVAINCGALNPQVLENQLFGNVKGAFTGAISDENGLIQKAAEGTLFLDEISEMPLDLQAKLLRVLEQGEFYPVGGSKRQTVKFRLIAATNRQLAQQVQNGLFREDLFHRLNTLTLVLPPLRERREDIPLLIRHFLHEISERRGMSPKKISQKAMRTLIQAPWPGNVRELENTLERICTLNSSPRIDDKHLPLEIKRHFKKKKPPSFEKAKDQFMKSYLDQILSQVGGNFPEAARQAGIERESFYRLTRRFGLQPGKRKGSRGRR